MRKVTLVLLSLISSSAMASYINNGTIIENGHWLGQSAYYSETPILAMLSTADVSLGAQANDLYIASNYKYHTTTNHTVYIVNGSNSKQTFIWYMESCPELYACSIRSGTIELKPGGEFCESGAIQPNVVYQSEYAVYTNIARTYSKGYNPQKVEDVAYIHVS
jgi:hypothetical protein